MFNVKKIFRLFRGASRCSPSSTPRAGGGPQGSSRRESTQVCPQGW